MRLHLIDGTYELFRAHFSKRPDHATPDGQKGKATLGLVSSLLQLVADPKERSRTWRWRSTTRSDRFATSCSPATRPRRASSPSCSRSSTPPRPRCARSASPSGRWIAGRRTTRWRRRRRASPREVDQVRILTPDKDLGQCIVGRRVVQVDRMRQKEYDEEALVAVRGVRAGEHPRLARAHRRRRRRRARAARLRRQERGGGAGEVRAPRAHPRRSQALAADGARRRAAGARRSPSARELAVLYRTLTRLVTDVPLPESLADLEWRGVPRLSFDEWCARFGATRALAQAPRAPRISR